MKNRKFRRTKPHVIEIKQRKDFNKNRISVGGNTIVYLDGKPLRMCRRIKLDIEACSPARVTLEMYAVVKSKTAHRLNRNNVSFHEIGSYFPREAPKRKRKSK